MYKRVPPRLFGVYLGISNTDLQRRRTEWKINQVNKNKNIKQYVIVIQWMHTAVSAIWGNYKVM